MEVTGEYRLKTGARPPAFDLPGTDGKRHRLADFADRGALVVMWWCNHCPYVRAWEERTLALAREYQGRGVGFVAISSNDVRQYPTDDMQHMRERAEEKQYPFPYLYDEPQDVGREWGAQVTPHYFVFAKRDGEFALAYQGRLDDNKDSPMAVKRQYVRDALEAVLAGRAPPEERTPALGCSVKWRM